MPLVVLLVVSDAEAVVVSLPLSREDDAFAVDVPAAWPNVDSRLDRKVCRSLASVVAASGVADAVLALSVVAVVADAAVVAAVDASVELVAEVPAVVASSCAK